MLRNITIAIVVVAVLIGAALGVYLFRPPEEASTPIEAVPIVIEATAESVVEPTATATEETVDLTATPTEDVVEPEPTAVEVEPTAEPEVEPTVELVEEPAENVAADTSEADEAVAESVDEGEATTAEVEEDVTAEAVEPVEESADEGEAGTTENAPAEETTDVLTIYEIVPAQSEARFLIGEILRGEPFTVVGVTDQVAGQFAINMNDLSTAQVGTIRVNARTLVTDNEWRNRAIKNAVLTTDEYEFIDFTPTEVVGLSGAGAVDQPVAFQIVGDLTIRDVTRSVTFEVTGTPISETEWQGFASASVLYADYNLFIPDSPASTTTWFWRSSSWRRSSFQHQSPQERELWKG